MYQYDYGDAVGVPPWMGWKPMHVRRLEGVRDTYLDAGGKHPRYEPPEGTREKLQASGFSLDTGQVLKGK
jgi:hypothetical protein